KAASRPDIVFNEDDWKKLEARLDAKSPHISDANNTIRKIIAAFALAILFIAGAVYWNFQAPDEVALTSKEETHADKIAELNTAESMDTKPGVIQPRSDVSRRDQKGIAENDRAKTNLPEYSKGLSSKKSLERSSDIKQKRIPEIQEVTMAEGQQDGDQLKATSVSSAIESGTGLRSVIAVRKDKIQRDFIQISPALADRIKQKASGLLPGAEEVDGSGKEEAIMKEERASNEKTALASPRLSLLLSLAPDFSSTSINRYTSPGGAYGAMIHYHIKRSWSISAGVVKNKKKYTGEGGDYQPPKGYWKYYTNGIIPETIDGSCNILEIPIMLQYTLGQAGRTRFLVGAGASSYLMLNESYQYNFEEPNPGAKEGWSSKASSRFYFNMINFTAGFEHQIIPGLLIGIEPYLKIPIEAIGWTNLKLFSTGASFTLRYQIVNKKPSLITRSRSPD
ncbi:MAG: hypothetical protein ABIR06_20490, partial [Cyclobacteriaceae bacterium]